MLVFSRQGMEIQDAASADAASGASVVTAGSDVTLVGTGTEVEIAVAAGVGSGDRAVRKVWTHRRSHG